MTAFTLNSGAVSSTWNGLPGGTYDVHAHYAGDGTFAASDSAPVTVTVSPEGSTTALSVFGFDVVGNLIPFTSQPYGTPAYLRADISALSGHGVATGNVLFFDNLASLDGVSYGLNSEGTAATARGVFTIPAWSAFRSGFLQWRWRLQRQPFGSGKHHSHQGPDHDRDYFEQQQRGSGYASDVDGHGEHQQRRTGADRAWRTSCRGEHQSLRVAFSGRADTEISNRAHS